MYENISEELKIKDTEHQEKLLSSEKKVKELEYNLRERDKEFSQILEQVKKDADTIANQAKYEFI